MLKETLSASKIKTLKSCSWQYWCKYHLKLPDKSNDGALKGDVVHGVLECLGEKRHRKHFDKILKNKDAFASKAVKRLILKKAKNNKVDREEHIDDIKKMIIAAVGYDFFGSQRGKVVEAVSEKNFEIEVIEKEFSYKVKGFIDKLFVYADKILIRDFKTNKKAYEGKEVTDNLQDYMYTLAVRKLYPNIKNVEMEFLFLKKNLSEGGVMIMTAKDKYDLAGFEHELTEIQKYADSFEEETALSNLAAEQGMPSDGSFSGKLLCGFATQPNEKKKDGTPKWYCTYKFPFKYFILQDEKGQQVKSAFNKEDLTKQKKKGYKIIEKQYEGCPHWNKPKPKIEDEDHFDLDKF